jgi:HlyD family secretion protein
MRRRLRDEQVVTGKALDRRRAEDATADAETAVFDAQAAVDRAATHWRATGAPTDTLTNARAALVRAQEELAKRQAALRAIDAPLLTPNEAQVVSARGDLALARVNLEKLRIRAPIDGTVLQININPGELAAPSALQPLALVANLSTLNVRAELDERDVAEIKVGQAALVRAAAFPGKEFAGTVASIAPLVEASRLGSRGPGNRSDVDAVEVVVKLTQPGPLAAGMKVDVYFSQGKDAAKTPSK